MRRWFAKSKEEPDIPVPPRLGRMERGQNAQMLMESPALHEALERVEEIYLAKMKAAEEPETLWLARQGLSAATHFKGLLMAMIRDAEFRATELEKERGELIRPLEGMPDYQAEAAQARAEAAWQFQKEKIA